MWKALAIRTIPTDPDLQFFVASYDLGALSSARGIEAGTVNTSYVLELESGRFFLRIYEEQDAVGAAREAGVLAHLARSGVPTPAPLPGRDGRSTRTVAGKPAALFPWIEGEQLCQRAVTAAAAETVGAALARIHVAGHAPDTPLDAGRFSPSELARRCERIAGSSDPEARAIGPALEAVVRAIAARRRTDAPSGLVHGDLFRDNVLWEPKAEPCRIAALLDFESAHDGPFAYDLAVTILSWCYGTELDLALAAAVVRGYRSVRELTPVDREVLHDETVFASVRFAITRITDDAIRVGKRWQRFVERREAVERLGPARFREALGL